MAASKPTSSLSKKSDLLKCTEHEFRDLNLRSTAVSVLTRGASPPLSNCRVMTSGIRSLVGLARLLPVKTIQCSTPRGNTRRHPKRCFGENQLLPGSISFSLQPTSHPKVLHGLSVRTSIRISADFILLMGRSPGFGSIAYDINFALFRLAFAVAPCI
jgi:hypothetical protein